MEEKLEFISEEQLKKLETLLNKIDPNNKLFKESKDNIENLKILRKENEAIIKK